MLPVLCKVIRVKIVTKHAVLLWAKNTRELRRLCSKHIICLYFYHEHSKCLPLALTDAVRSWRHCYSAQCMIVWTSYPINKQPWIWDTLYRQWHYNKVEKMHTSPTYFMQISVFVLYFEWVFAESYVIRNIFCDSINNRSTIPGIWRLTCHLYTGYIRHLSGTPDHGILYFVVDSPGRPGTLSCCWNGCCFRPGKKSIPVSIDWTK